MNEEPSVKPVSEEGVAETSPEETSKPASDTSEAVGAQTDEAGSQSAETGPNTSDGKE